MISGTHSVIRTASREDASALLRYYSAGRPKASLLDPRRERIMPTEDELAGLVGGGALEQLGGLSAIEDGTGVVRGFCAVRSAPNEPNMSLFVLMFEALSDFDSPLASEAMEYLREEAFGRQRLRKALVNLLDSEHEARALMLRHGFQSNGMQREVLYTEGRWHDLETLSLFSPAHPAR